MPEAGEVALQGEYIKKFLSQSPNKSSNQSKIIIGIQWDQVSKYYRKPLKGMNLVKLPLRVREVFTRGKIIVFVCLNKDREPLYITSHLGMSGYYTTQKIKHSNFWFSFGKEKEGFYEETSRLYFNDQRHFGNFTICSNLDEIWKKNGPCLLTTALKNSQNSHQKTVSREYWHSCFKNKKTKICDFLMEQKHFSGIGNYLRAEIMYHSKISPERLVSSLSFSEIDLLYDKSLEIIHNSYQNKGPASGYIKEGCFQLFVYGREKDPYGNPVLTYQSKGRTVHYCPKVQK